MRTKPAAMLWELIGRLANSSLTIRISGEHGVGKEAIARLLYNHYPQKDAVFRKFSCLDLGLVSQSKKTPGFCDKIQAKLDRAMASPQNTVFFFENIELLPQDMQIRLNELLNRDYAAQPPWVFVSSIEPLEWHLRKNNIDDQLFDALDIIHIALPPLRKRPDRIPQILSWLLSQAKSDDGASMLTMPDIKSMQQLVEYHWPGNWRQLQQVTLEAIQSNEWPEVVDGMKEEDADNAMNMNEMVAIHILSSAKLSIHKEKVMDGLMTSASMEEVGMLDLAIFNEAVAQIADHLSTSGAEENRDPTSGS